MAQKGGGGIKHWGKDRLGVHYFESYGVSLDIA